TNLSLPAHLAISGFVFLISTAASLWILLGIESAHGAFNVAFRFNGNDWRAFDAAIKLMLDQNQLGNNGSVRLVQNGSKSFYLWSRGGFLEENSFRRWWADTVVLAHEFVPGKRRGHIGGLFLMGLLPVVLFRGWWRYRFESERIKKKITPAILEE